jgi:Peptidase family M1 domain/Peptidase M1 N-terminal domain
MRRGSVVFTSVALAVLLPLAVSTASGAAARTRYIAGSSGVGDPYYPLYGNGGYDVSHYLLQVSYQPDTKQLRGVATISARATANLYRFNLDLQGLRVHSVAVDGKQARWSRNSDHELVIWPRKKLNSGHRFTTVVSYGGVPRTQDLFGGVAGFIPTDDGAVVAGEPEVAANWFPVNDHPSDKASYTFEITVPNGVETIANGHLVSKRKHGATTTWTWNEAEPMASYLATATMGQFRTHHYRADGLEFLDAVDPDLYQPIASPHTGSQYLYSSVGDSSYKRVTRQLAVPAGGGHLTFWIARDTEPTWDFTFVEARTPGQDDWTTLPDVNGHNSQETGNSCPSGWQGIHPQLAHYQTPTDDGGCTPTGTTGSWWAATGASDGWEQWDVDLSGWAGETVEISIAYASDESVQGKGVLIDDIVTPTGDGSTSFENDADPLDGWVVAGPPVGSPANPNDFAAVTSTDVQTTGDVIDAVFAREPEILRFLASKFGPYPFHQAGGIVDDVQGLGFALENQTRPIYSKDFFSNEIGGDDVVVHELAHQWYGDSVSVHRWRDVWLNEGFATYAEWLWSAAEGLGSEQEIFDANYNGIPADDEFWTVPPADPGVDELFGGAVYTRGAMALHALRMTVGDDDFFTTLRRWAATRAGGTGSTAQFIGLAEQISGQDLGTMFNDWLYGTVKPPAPPGTASPAAFRARAQVATRLPGVFDVQARLRR